MTQPMDYEGFLRNHNDVLHHDKFHHLDMASALAFIRAAVPLLRDITALDRAISEAEEWIAIGEPAKARKVLHGIRTRKKRDVVALVLTATFPDDFGSDQPKE